MEQTKKKKKKLRKFIFWLIVVLILLFVIFYLSHQGEHRGAGAYFGWLCDLIAQIYNFFFKLYYLLFGDNQKNSSHNQNRNEFRHQQTRDKNYDNLLTGGDVQEKIVTFLVFCLVFLLLLLIFKFIWVKFIRPKIHLIIIIFLIIYILHDIACLRMVNVEYFDNLAKYIYIIGGQLSMAMYFLKTYLASQKMARNKALTGKDIKFLTFFWIALYLISLLQDEYLAPHGEEIYEKVPNLIDYIITTAGFSLYLYLGVCLIDYLFIKQKFLDKHGN